MRVLAGLVPLASLDRTAPPSTAQRLRIPLRACNEGSSRTPGRTTQDPHQYDGRRDPSPHAHAGPRRRRVAPGTGRGGRRIPAAGRRRRAAPDIEVERPANPDHGDLATNLAMKLARPYRKAPLEIATLLAAKLVRDAAATVPRPRSRRSRSRRRASSTSAASRRPSRRSSTASSPSRRPGAASSRSDPRRSTSSSCRPTRPARSTSATRAGRSSATCSSRVLEAGGQRVTREYYFNDSGGQIDNLGASVAAHPARRAGARGRLPRRLRPRPRGAGARTTSGRRRRADGADAAAIVGRWAAGRVRRGHRGEPRAARRPFRRVDERGVAPRRRAGSSARSSACGSAATSTSRTARCGSARPRSATTRTASSTARTGSRPTSPPTSAT